MTIQYSKTLTAEMMLRDLWSNLSNMVEAGEISDIEAMEWYNRKADKWNS